MPKPTLHIFLAGTHTPTHGATLSFSESDLAATAAAYDPAKHEAPLVVGHPKTDDPAYGWVQSVIASGPDLEVTPRAVDPAFAEMVRDEKFTSISASFFLPGSPSNPVPGVYYLKHVGFLGAVPPAVRGLRKPSFDLADRDDESITIEFSISPDSPEEVTIVPDPVPNTPATPPASPTIDFAAQAATLSTENAELRRQLAEQQTKQLRSEIASFAESLIDAGRLLPADKSGVIEFLAAIPAEQTIEFASGDGQPLKPKARDWFESFLRRLPVQVDFAERSAAAAVVSPTATVQFAAPSGYDVDTARLELHQRALDHSRHHNVSYEQALAALGGR